MVVLPSHLWPILSMSRTVGNSAKLSLSHLFGRKKNIDHWAVDPHAILNPTTSAKIAKTAIDLLLTFKKWPLQSGCNLSTAYVDQWTNGKTRNHVSSLHSLLMQLCALETHIWISRNLKKLVDLIRNHRSGPEPSPCPLQAQASGPKISGNLIVGRNCSA